MSQEAENQALTGKAKKAKRSEERYKKGKKRKAEETAAEDKQNDQVLGAHDTSTQDAQPNDSGSKKRKRSGDEQTTAQAPAEDAGAAESKQNKKRKKQPPTEAGAEGGAEGGDDAGAPSKQRFIVFIGNLPYTATTDTISAHFASIQPTSIRHRTEPGSNKSKGFAFLEFSNYDRMKTCLKLFHHSVFDSGVGGERGKRRINVELTAGGGGKSEQRKEKLKEKNVRLNEQRQRRAEAVAKQEKRKAQKEALKGGKRGQEQNEEEAPPEAVDEEGMHPARLAMMQRGGR